MYKILAKRSYKIYCLYNKEGSLFFNLTIKKIIMRDTRLHYITNLIRMGNRSSEFLKFLRNINKVNKYSQFKVRYSILLFYLGFQI
jgi:hypothetical protein